MKYQRGLQVKLQERYRRLYESDENSYLTEIRYFHNSLLSVPVIKAILTTLVEGEKDFDGDAWFSANFSYKNYSWPRSEGAKLKLVWKGNYTLGDPKAYLFTQESSLASLAA